MNWDALSAVGEIIGAAAVVVTLIYLAGQVRQATQATQAANFQAASTLEHDFLLFLGQDPATARTWATFMFGDPSALPEAERLQGTFLMGAALRRLENVFHQYRLGTISKDAWDSRREMFATVAHSKAFDVFNDSPARRFIGGDFMEFMTRLAEGRPGLSGDSAPDV